MIKFLTLISVSFACTVTPLFAQITREQANAIVLEYIQEIALPYTLYVHTNAPKEDIVLTTFSEEVIKIKYACWAYYLNENPGTSEPARQRYFFVKENNGNLLEIITNNDLAPEDLLTQWIDVDSLMGINEQERNDMVRLYPNPTNGKLRITNYELRIDRIEVFDVYGKKLLLMSPLSKEATINIAHLPAGVYFIRIKTETGVVTKKAIKN